jgi:hypothetical protein
MIKRKGLKTKLEFEFETDFDIPDLNYDVPLKKEAAQPKNKINIVIKKKRTRDASINLF